MRQVFSSLMTSNLACRFMSPCSMMMWSLITVWKRWRLNHREDMIFTIPQLWLYTLVRLYNVKISMLKGWYFNMSWATYWITFKSESQISATYVHKCYKTVWAKAVNKIFFPLSPPPVSTIFWWTPNISILKCWNTLNTKAAYLLV